MAQCNLELCLKYCTVKFQLGAKCWEMGCEQGLWPPGDVHHSGERQDGGTLYLFGFSSVF